MSLDLLIQHDNLAKEKAAGPGWPGARGLGPEPFLLLRPQGRLSQGPWNVEVPPSFLRLPYQGDRLGQSLLK